MTIQITSSEGRPVADAALESLVARVYVEEGFTPPELAATLFAAKAVRARGALLLAWIERRARARRDGHHGSADIECTTYRACRRGGDA